MAMTDVAFAVEKGRLFVCGDDRTRFALERMVDHGGASDRRILWFTWRIRKFLVVLVNAVDSDGDVRFSLLRSGRDERLDSRGGPVSHDLLWPLFLI